MIINISTSTGFFSWQPAAWLRLAGPDAASFLQGQFTNDLRALETQPAVYGLWLNVKAKVLADSFVLRGGDEGEFWVGSYFSPAAVIGARLESHLIADDVTIEDRTGAWAGMSVFGAAAERLRTESRKDGFVFPGRRGRGGNVEWVFPADGLTAAREFLCDGREIDPDEILRSRIAAGIPAVPFDVGPGDLPNEGGLEADAISYTKGCYMGQEVIARLKAMGQVRRRLMRVSGPGENHPALPAALFADGRRVGELRSAVGDGAGGLVGLAMLSLLHLAPMTALAFAADTPPVLRPTDVL